MICKYELCLKLFDRISNHQHYCSKKCQEAARRRNIRKAVFIKYGGKCTCCGETTIDFLTIDHKNNDGAKERKSGYSQKRLGSNRGIGTSDLYRKYLKEPLREDLQILCANCNTAKQNRKNFGGKCPHQLSILAGT